MKRKIFALLVAALFVFLTACASSQTSNPPSVTSDNSTAAPADSAPEAPQGGVIGVIPKSTLYNYWKYVEMGAQKAAAEYGYSIVYQGTATDTDVEGQVKIIEDFVTQGVKAIVISPVDESALVPALQAAHDKGIVIIIIDGSLNADFPYATISTDDYSAGEQAAEEMLKLIGDQSGKIAVVSYVAGSVQGSNRCNGFIDKIKNNEKLELLNTY